MSDDWFGRGMAMWDDLIPVDVLMGFDRGGDLIVKASFEKWFF